MWEERERCSGFCLFLEKHFKSPESRQANEQKRGCGAYAASENFADDPDQALCLLVSVEGAWGIVLW